MSLVGSTYHPEGEVVVEVIVAFRRDLLVRRWRVDLHLHSAATQRQKHNFTFCTCRESCSPLPEGDFECNGDKSYYYTVFFLLVLFYFADRWGFPKISLHNCCSFAGCHQSKLIAPLLKNKMTPLAELRDKFYFFLPSSPSLLVCLQSEQPLHSLKRCRLHQQNHAVSHEPLFWSLT